MMIIADPRPFHVDVPAEIAGRRGMHRLAGRGRHTYNARLVRDLSLSP
jgi:hypothetical protein